MKLIFPKGLINKDEYLMLVLEDKIKLLKFCYGYDDPTEELPEDIIFDNMIMQLPDTSPIKYLDWDMVTFDEVKHILDALGFVYYEEGEEEIQKEIQNKELQKLWGKNKSITMEDSLEGAKKVANDMLNMHNDIIKHMESYKLVMLLKYDGWNLTVYYIPGQTKPVLIHTRARYGESIYCTHLLADIMPEIDVDEPVRVVGELCMDTGALEILRNKYNDGRPFKNTRNSISSVVHGTVDANLIRDHIHFIAFTLEGVEDKAAETVLDTLDILDSLGFETPVRCAINDLENFEASFKYMEESYKKIEEDIKCDGVVLEPNFFEVQKACNEFVSGNNQKGLLAIKDSYWSRKIYKGKVIDIISPPTKLNRSFVAIVEPVMVSSGSDVQRIPLNNLNIAKSYGRYVDVGDTILFTYHSEQNIHFEGFAEGVI